MSSRTVVSMPGWRSSTAAWTLLVLYVGAIVVASSQPAEALPLWVRTHDSIVHAIGYGTLGLLIATALSRSIPELPGAGLLALGVLAVANIGLLDELYQTLQPGRHATLDDAAIDVGSAALAITCLVLVRWRRR